MPIQKESTKRPYLSREQRRKHLLDTAAAMVESQGWDKLSMSALALRAQTSRQLVYQHFSSLEDLMVATGTHIFEQVYVQTRATIEQGSEDIVATLSQAQAITLDLPRGRAQALWQIIAAAFPADHELSRFGRRMRHLITRLWQPAVAKAFKLDEQAAAATTWMLIMAFWGGYRLVEDGELSKEQAVERLNWMVACIRSGLPDS
ncbi:MAG: TetR/AcrR family transcriptional regulator [Salinisphaeraceae bacterium]|nr:TetR/AcrR family transcriptional regulator [Salinisphaeraceae bacterium]